MTNVEIDDVLSSIRRLVSEEKPKKPVVAPESDRFVLTPALRVMDDPVPEAPGRDAMRAPVTPRPAAPLELRQYLATPAPANQTPPEPPVSPEYQAMEQAWESELARFSTQRPEPDEVAPAAAAPSEATSLETRIAELEAAVSMAGEEWEPDGSEPGFGQPPRHHIFEVVDNSAQPDDAPRTDETAGDKTAETGQGAETSVEMPFFNHAAAPSPSKVPDPAPVPAAQTEHPAKPLAATPDAAIVPEMDVAPELPQGHDPIPFPRPGDVVEDDDVFLDVEALREMISDVVRAELHGKMGETITRNVRRMVQQEIERALTHRPADSD